MTQIIEVTKIINGSFLTEVTQGVWSETLGGVIGVDRYGRVGDHISKTFLPDGWMEIGSEGTKITVVPVKE